MNQLKDRFRQCREGKKLSQAALAKVLQCGQSTIASIENGRNKGSTIIPQAAAFFGVNAVWLDSGKGAKEADTLPSHAVREEAAPGYAALPAHIQQIVEAIQHRPASDPVIKAISLIIAGADSDSVQESTPAGGYIAKAIQAGDSFEAKRRKRRTGTS